jgi:hypothetical protein
VAVLAASRKMLVFAEVVTLLKERDDVGNDVHKDEVEMLET